MNYKKIWNQIGTHIKEYEWLQLKRFMVNKEWKTL